MCSIPGCARSAHARGWCDTHYRRWRTHGDPLAGAVLPENERFWSHVHVGLDHWLWAASTTSHGYGQFWTRPQDDVPPKNIGAHRYAWILEHGPIPGDLWVLHACDTPACVWPQHLFLGDAAANAADCVAKGRTYQPPRDLNSNTKITTTDIGIARSLVASGMPVHAVAQRYGVHPNTLYKALRNH